MLSGSTSSGGSSPGRSSSSSGCSAGRDYLLGEFSAADCAAFPFLKYGLLYDEADTEEFHLILGEYLALNGGYPRLEAWIRRVDARPRA